MSKEAISRTTDEVVDGMQERALRPLAQRYPGSGLKTYTRSPLLLMVETWFRSRTHEAELIAIGILHRRPVLAFGLNCRP